MFVASYKDQVLGGIAWLWWTEQKGKWLIWDETQGTEPFWYPFSSTWFLSQGVTLKEAHSLGGKSHEDAHLHGKGESVAMEIAK